MKKFLKMLVVFAVACFAAMPLFACTPTPATPKDVTVKVYAPDGAPALALGNSMNNFESAIINKTEYKVEYNVIASDKIGTTVASGTPDVAVMPVNAAANLYNKNGAYVCAGVVTHGNLYIVGSGLNSLSDLKGKVVGVIGKGNVPDLVFRALLTKAQIEYVASETAVENKVAVRYYSDGTSVIGALSASVVNCGLLGEPAATNARTKLSASEKADVAAIGSSAPLDVQKAWGASFGGNDYPQAALIVKKTFLQNNGEFVTEFIKSVKDNSGFAEAHLDDVKNAIKLHLAEGVADSTAKITLDVYQRCNVYFESAADAKADVEVLLNEFIKLNTPEQQILGKLPDSGFYMTEK